MSILAAVSKVNSAVPMNYKPTLQAGVRYTLIFLFTALPDIDF